LIGLAETLTRLAGTYFDNAKRQGTAQVTSCVRHGPITSKGFGYWDSCTATITWDDAGIARVTVRAVFTSTDIGTSVRVGDLGDYRTSEQTRPRRRTAPVLTRLARLHRRSRRLHPGIDRRPEPSRAAAISPATLKVGRIR
jgi:uncharacterized protein DUF6346